MTRTKYPRPNLMWLVTLGWIVFGVSVVLISGVSMMPTDSVPSGHHMDKVLHAAAYAVVTCGMVFAWPKRALPVILAVAFGMGTIIEICQGLFASGRTASIADALANGLGALIVILSWITVHILFYRNSDKRDFLPE